MEIRITFVDSYDNDAIVIRKLLGRDDTITFLKDDTEVYHQPEEHVIYNLSLKKGNLKSVEVTI